MKLKIRSRMLLLVLITVVVIYVSAIGYISFSFRNRSFDDAIKITDTYAIEAADLVNSGMNVHIGTARALADVTLGYIHRSFGDRFALDTGILRNILVHNPEYIAVFMQWELRHIWEGYDKPYGRLRYTFHRKNEIPALVVDTLDLEGDNIEGIYYQVKKKPVETITNPYYYSYSTAQALPMDTRQSKTDVLETTIIIPVLQDETYIGMVGMDIPTTQFQEVMSGISPFNESYAFLLSYNGNFVYHPDTALINRNIGYVFPEENETHNILQGIREGRRFSFLTSRSSLEPETYLSFAPIQIGNTDTPWFVAIVVPVRMIMQDAWRSFYVSIASSFLGLILLTIIMWIIARNITLPIEKTTSILSELAEGKIDRTGKLDIRSGDELEEMADSANKLIDGLNSTVAFARKIGEGDLGVQYTFLSEQDALGNALVDMRDRLRESREKISKQAASLVEANRELQKLSVVVSETDNAVCIMSPEGKLEWMNDAFVKLYGYTLEEYILAKGPDLSTASNYGQINELLATCRDTRKSVSYSSHQDSRSGERIWCHTTLTPILDQKGTIQKLVSIDSDITKLKEAEDEIARQRDNLAILNAAKDKFFSIIAHDLKNPFSVLLSVTESLTLNYRHLSEEEKSFAIRQINDSVKLLYNLLENLLKWSMAQTGRLQFKPGNIDLYQLVLINVSILALSAEKKQISISTDLEEGLFAFADKEMIDSVVRNLLTNAIKYNEPGGKIFITAARDNGRVVLSVEDTGIGIPSEDLEKLFRIDLKTKRIGTAGEKGTGLGLILSREFIERNGGRLTVESEAGEGSRFSFTLPVTEASGN